MSSGLNFRRPSAASLNILPDGEGWWFSRGAATPVAEPLDTFLFKIASRCNLACPYCYVYESRDQGWRSQPTFMEMDTYRRALGRIREHIIAHGVSAIALIFHGGEPLLVGAQRLDEMATEAEKQLGDVTDINFGMQTNGTLLNETFLATAMRHKIRIGLSVDGPPKHHDRLRFYHDGSGSSASVENAARLLSSNPDVFGGMLCVVNLEIDPAEVWEYLTGFHPRSIDLLLPLSNHDCLPPGSGSLREVRRYGQWMARFAELWFQAGQERPDVRFFTSIMRLLLGSHSLVESIGLGLTTLIVIESNGDLEAVDSLKSCYPGAARTGLDVYHDTLDDALRIPSIISRQMGVSALCATCRDCRFVKICGAGYQPHRYSASHGFQNPSIYCESLQVLITRIAAMMRQELIRLNIPLPLALETLADARLPD